MIFNSGDRICHIAMPSEKGTIVSGGLFGKENEVSLQWDSLKYNSQYRYSLLKCKYIRKLTKLERALS